jgi:hypothetical protein
MPCDPTNGLDVSRQNSYACRIVEVDEFDIGFAKQEGKANQLRFELPGLNSLGGNGDLPAFGVDSKRTNRSAGYFGNHAFQVIRPCRIAQDLAFSTCHEPAVFLRFGASAREWPDG